VSNLENKYLGIKVETINNDVSMMYDSRQNNFEKLAEYANANGLEIVIPGPKELFIDLDSEQSYELFKNQLEVLQQFFEAGIARDEPSRSGLPHRHIVVTVAVPKNEGTNGVPSEMEKMALQTMLGSDRRCEILRYMRWRQHDPHPTLFLEKRTK
jgi:hypothetical protein